MIFNSMADNHRLDMAISLLNGQTDQEIAVISTVDKELLFANDALLKRLDNSSPSFDDFENSLPGLDEYFLPGRNGKIIIDTEGEETVQKAISVQSMAITWDGLRPAIALYMRDITDDWHNEQSYYHLAYYDQLTGVPNRLKFVTDFNEIIRQIAARQCRGAMVLVDMDHFKEVNDTHGHQAGDLMLKHLTKFFKSNSQYANSIYRLGGDEFVLVFTDSPNRFETEDEFMQYYSSLIDGMMQDYSLPDFDAICTLSVGISMFPKHGSLTSELLRKADIALYKAKENGRNCYVFFEDQYDAAKKYKDMYINMQPVLDLDGQTHAYELFDINSSTHSKDSNQIQMGNLNRSLDLLGVNDMNKDKVYFINTSLQLLTPTVLQNLPKDIFVIQIVDDVKASDLELYLKLRQAGYSLSLKNIKSTAQVPQLLKLVQYCHIKPNQMNDDLQKRLIGNNKHIRFILDNVYSMEQYEAGKALGYTLFSGRYFSAEQPVIKKTKDIDPLKVNYYRLLQMTSSAAYVDFHKISAIIENDVALSYKLLRLLNSAAVGLRNIPSISRGLTYLGEANLKKWIGLLALRGVAEDKPLELVRISLVRARFGELLAPHIWPRNDINEVFLCGMLSLLHIALEISKEDMLSELPVAEAVSISLLGKDGPYSPLLAFFEAYEYSNWDDVSVFGREHGLGAAKINEYYTQAVQWYNDLVM